MRDLIYKAFVDGLSEGPIDGRCTQVKWGSIDLAITAEGRTIIELDGVRLITSDIQSSKDVSIVKALLGVVNLNCLYVIRKCGPKYTLEART